MNTKAIAWRFAFVISVLLLFSAEGMAQKVPVQMLSDSKTNEDQMALKFSKSLSDEIQLSGKFYYWNGGSFGFPLNGVTIVVRSIQVKLGNGEVIGSAIFVEAELANRKDPEYYKVCTEEILMIPKGASVADETRSFLAAVDRTLERK